MHIPYNGPTIHAETSDAIFHDRSPGNALGGMIWAGRGREEGVQKSRIGSEESCPLSILRESVVRGAFRKHARIFGSRANIPALFRASNSKHK